MPCQLTQFKTLSLWPPQYAQKHKLEHPDSYIEEVIILLNEEIQESEKRRGGKSDDVVIIAFNFPYKQPTQALLSLAL
jgi:hypothetical protein